MSSRSISCIFCATALGMVMLGCGDTGLVCGPGTHEEGGACVPDSEGTGGNGGAGAAASQGGSGGIGGAGAGGLGGASIGGGGSGGGAVDPGYPEYPAVIDHLSFAVRTGEGTFDGTDANALSLCLTATDCFPMNVLDVNDFRRGEIDVYHFTGVGLARSDVDRVEIRSENGTDAWRPVCLEVQFDGEPVYCEDSYDFVMGSGAGELASFVDPAALHEACVRCYPDPIAHGPMIGAVTDTSAELFLRTEATRKVEVLFSESGVPGAGEVVAYLYPGPTEDFTQGISLKGLKADKSYDVSFRVDGENSLKQVTFRTAKPPGAGAAFSVGYGSCAKFDDQPIFTHIAGHAPDLFLFGGDNHYGNTPDLESLWWNYRWGLERPARAELARTTPTIAVWDDHDFVGNNTTAVDPGKENALRAFTHYWANLGYGAPGTPGIFSTYTYGDVTFYLLDDRYYRSLETDATGTMLGAGQTAWLKEQLLSSSAVFNVLVTGSIWSQTGGETWTDFPGARADLFDFIRDNGIGGVVVLGGDVHRSGLRKIHREAAGGYDLPEIISSPLANVNSTCPASAEPDAVQIACLDDNTFFAILDFDTTAADPTLVVKIFDGSDAERASMSVKRSELQ